MRVLMISDVFFPRINGVSTSIDSFRHALAHRGIEVRVIAPAYPAPHADDERILRVPARRVPLDPEDRLMRGSALDETLSRLAAERFDLVHVQTPFAAHYAGLRFARQKRLPCLATYHTHFEEYLHNYVPLMPKAALRAFARALARRQCNALDGVVVPSSAMEETLVSYGVTTPLYRVPTGIPVEHFALACRSASADFRRRFDIPARAPLALYVGRAAHEKNIGFLLEALPHAHARIPGLMLVIAGEGPALPALRRQAAALGIVENVRFVGYLDRMRELPACYAAADVFVFASRTETQGLVLLEAMAAGLPVLAFSALGTREIVEPRRGAMPAPQETRAFGAALAELIEDVPRRRAMAHEARTFAQEWTTEACARRLAEAYRSVHARHASSQPRHERFITP
ncbi:MAG: glycosyltransferase [Rhodocyclaceae bacterium]|jgi:1,2-diacylglycerol 3-alpha-glucosyltransferase|nr:glycosyltransferase [Rhodocyclaceae bacterium]